MAIADSHSHAVPDPHYIMKTSPLLSSPCQKKMLRNALRKYVHFDILRYTYFLSCAEFDEKKMGL